MRKLILLTTLVSFTLQSQNITVASGKSFTIEKTGSVTMSGNFSNAGNFTLNSDSDEFSSIIIDGSVSGNITYNRFVNSVGTNEWDLIGSPVSGQSINSFVSANASTLATSSNIYAIGFYNNSNNTWTNFTSADFLEGEVIFPVGLGFQMATIANGTGILSFTGSPAASNQTWGIANNDAANSGAGTRWNLVANPFPSYIQGNANADSSHNFLTINSDKLDDSYEAIYGYDADGSGYTVYNNTSSSLNLAPGQAFMVASDNTENDNISFTTAMRTIVGGDDLIVGDILEDTFELIIKLYEGDTEQDFTRFYFADGLSLGLDPGYDAGNFNQGASLMSRLVEEDEGVGLVINAMGLESVNDVVVPLEINMEAGNNFRISIGTFDIYAGTNVYLEDNVQGTMTLLNEQEFELTPENNLSGVGRFFLHLTETTFSIDDEVETNLLNVYKLDRNNFIIVEGLASQANKTRLDLYNLLGKKVLSINLSNHTNSQTISTEGLFSGIYVIKLQSINSLLTKKLIVK